MVLDSIPSNIDEVLSINPSGDVFVFQDFMSIIRTGLAILVELIDLVNSVIISNNLSQMTNFPTWIPDCDSHRPALLNSFLLMLFPPYGNSDHVAVTVSIDFPSNLQWDAPVHWIAYFCSDWGSLHDHLRDVSWEDVFLLLLVNFVSGFRPELMHISLIESIRSSLIHLHDCQLLVQLPQFIEITFFICTNRLNLPNLK